MDIHGVYKSMQGFTREYMGIHIRYKGIVDVHLAFARELYAWTPLLIIKTGLHKQKNLPKVNRNVRISKLTLKVNAK